MSDKIPSDLLYSAEHVWLRIDDERRNEGTVGITDFAQQQLGDVVYLELPKEGAALMAGAPFGEIESAKTVVELFAPVSGAVMQANLQLVDRPELVNESPYEEGWIIRVQISAPSELQLLHDADAYRALLPPE